MEKDPSIYVRHMLEAIANIEADTAGYDFERFRSDRRSWPARCHLPSSSGAGHQNRF